MLVINAALLGLHAIFTNTLDDSPRTQEVLFGALRFLSGASANFYTIALVLGKLVWFTDPSFGLDKI